MSRLLLLATLPLAAQFGQFQNAIRAEFLPDGREIQLLEDLVYIDENGHRWTAPKGSRVDGASIPQTLWSLIGGPYEGKYREASVIHDVECQRRTAPWEHAHYRFYTGMRARDVGEKQALGMYAAVRLCGPQWLADGTRVPSPACPVTRIKNLLSWASGAVLFESTAHAAERAKGAVQTARAESEKWSVELAAIEKVERDSGDLWVASMPPPPSNETAAQRRIRQQLETMIAVQRKDRSEQIRARKTNAQAAAEKAREALQAAEAELQTPTRRPLPPATIEEIQKLTIADIEP